MRDEGVGREGREEEKEGGKKGGKYQVHNEYVHCLY